MSGPDRHDEHTPENPSPELVLAAVARAALHRARELAEAPAWAICAHLALPRRSAAARAVVALLASLERDGRLARSRRHGVEMWSLTELGARELKRVRRQGDPSLPESPQHIAWRDARRVAAQEIERFREDLGASLQEGRSLLEDEPPPSDTWFELAQRLQGACWRLGSATHCLHEWPEPDDARADIDDRRERGDEHCSGGEAARRRARRVGRRNTRLWQ